MESSPKIRRGVALTAGLVVIGVFALLASLPAPRVPDQVQITSQLEAARRAVEARDIFAVTRIVSHRYHEPDVSSHGHLRSLLQKVQGNRAVRITQTAPVITVRGDTATSVCHVRVVTPADDRVIYDRDVTVQWAREDGTRLGVFPAKVWRAVSAE